ncbi:DnaJ domain-containing protein [Sulfurospirillum arcachonense]|uniref:DnaJ domain-containing protein n=1 Tax=Sulfurospirillum arcachonense TaxID=57666 RepID=UPI0004699A7A|nr:DnaJ domain-containing protein [Sulfurospirillum arcachonense]
MKKIIGFSIIALGIFLEVLWLGVCFGTVIVGIALLIFAPRILFFPFNFFFVIGIAMIAGGSFQNGANFRYQSNFGGNQQSPNFAQPQSSLSKYYEVLESKPTDSMDEIKKNYRRLVREYHYDSIASKDLPEDMLKFAEQKTKDLNEAYSAIKEARG